MSKINNPKVKIISLVILGLLAAPALLFPQEAGEVLGINETKGNGEGQINSDGNIGSGARDIKNDEGEENEEKTTEYTGKALWDANQKSDISTDKLALGQTITVKSGDITKSMVVSELREETLSEDTILILNTETYISLGGNPEEGLPLNITVITD